MYLNGAKCLQPEINKLIFLSPRKERSGICIVFQFYLSLSLMNIQKRAITTSSNGTFFSILDNPLENWLYDISTAAFSILRPELFFSSDVLRILFDYILNGPEENLVWDVKHILSSHFELHPPCTEPMRQFYLSLLSQAHKEESYFLSSSKVFFVHLIMADGSVSTFFMQQKEHICWTKNLDTELSACCETLHRNTTLNKLKRKLQLS